MGRFYRAESKPEKPQDTPGLAGPEGRFYRPSSEAPKGDKPAEDVDVLGEADTEEPIEAASVLAGDPPTKAEMKAAKKADSDDAEPDDLAAETVQEDPIAAASEMAGDPPPAPPAKKTAAKKTAAKKSGN